MLASWKKSCDKPRQHNKKPRRDTVGKVLYSQSYGFSSSHVRMWELNHKEGWELKNWYFWTVVLKYSWNTVGSEEIKPVNPGNQPWIFTGRTDAETEALIFWPPDVKSWLMEKDPDSGIVWGQEERGRGNRGWDGWMASLTWWTCVWANSRRQWRRGKPGVLQFMRSQRVRHDLATGQQQRSGSCAFSNEL